jgi:hypothetical protein
VGDRFRRMRERSGKELRLVQVSGFQSFNVSR